jgi:hypothetical protein
MKNFILIPVLIGLIACSSFAQVSQGTGYIPSLGKKANDTAAGACNTAKKGKAYFNTTTGVYRVCDGSTWANVSTGITASSTDVLTNKTINGANNTLAVRVANDVSGLGTGVATALGTAVGSAGAPVVNGGAGGTPSSISLTNGTGLPVSGITASTSTALGVGSIELGHATDTTLTRSSAGVLAVEGVVVDTISAANTLTNKTLTAPVITSPTGFSFKAPIFGQTVGNTIGAGSTVYMGLPGFNAASGTESSRQTVVPLAGTIKNFYLVTTGAQPGDASLTVTLRKNGVDTGVTFTIAAGAAAAVFSDVTHSFTVVAGDLLTVKFVNASGSASATIAGYSAEFDAS